MGNESSEPSEACLTDLEADLPGKAISALALAMAILLAALGGSATPRPPNAAQASSLSLANLQGSASAVPLYEKFELTFSVDNSAATNLQFPYDAAPPPGLVGRTGISVEGLFLPSGESDWQRAIRQSGFLYQDYQRQLLDGREWLYPEGDPVWKVRFAPQTTGVWQYKVRAQDASICPADVEPCPNWAESATGQFTALPAPPRNHGFVVVNEADPRYFALSDGQHFLGLGHNTAFSPTRFTYDADEQLAKYAANGIDFLRTWISGSAIAGSAWSPWVWFGGPNYGGYLPDPGLSVAPPGSGHDFTFNLDQQSNRLCLFNGWNQGHIAVKPATSYRLSITARVDGLSGPRNASRPDFGLTVKLGGWPSSCPEGLAASPAIVQHLRDANWTTLEGTVTTGASQWFLDNLFLLLDNATSGTANVSQVSLREVMADGSLGPELLAKSKSDMHMDFNLPRSWDWDYALERAAEQGVYLKLVVLEKNDRVWNLIKPDGTIADKESNDNFYAAEGTKVRRLQEYYWRYLASRWGYATAVHSWELLNEGDPFSGAHHELANGFAAYMHRHEPSRHLVTTSLWHSHPVAELWGNPAYREIDYADLHAYISTGVGSYEWTAPTGTALETDPARTNQGSAGAIRVPAGVTSPARSLWVRGRGDWRISVMIRSEGVVGSCPYGTPADLAGPQLVVALEGVATRVVPFAPDKPEQYWICTSPAGTHDYTIVEGTLPSPDDDWHLLTVKFRNGFARQGTAWFDNLVIQGPDGRTARVYGDGTFDDHERMDFDTALYNDAYGRRIGAASLSGSGKPVVRGEGGIDHAGGSQQELPELAIDRQGVWLHNLLWGTLNPSGLYELYWWTDNIVKNGLHFQYKHLRDFLEGIPLGNGSYRNAEAWPSNRDVRAVGQKDTTAGRAHLWIQNKQHSWWNAVNGVPWGRLSGTVALSGFAPRQTYPVQWWHFNHEGEVTIRDQSLTANDAGALTLDLDSLPAEVTDTGIKIGDFGPGHQVSLYPILK
ncbi:MAG: hypothetical protein ACYC4L_03170 [Chloroflexota bacterium]